MSTPLRVGLIGLGTVASGVAEVLTAHVQRTNQRADREISITRVAVRDLSKVRTVDIPAEILTTDAMSVATADDVDLVVELIGGISPAKELVEAALKAGKDVVTANKA
ncbi:MAG: homoserine dehydrogenase, partial [Planctomicrobium sp.]|nr:homoserine dehydrogenase [Planctomicrobium sp.]